MSPGLRAVALVIVLLLLLLGSAPARLLGLVLPAEQVVMQGFSGTLWRGQAGRVLVQVGPGYLHLGTVHWRLAPWSVLLLTPRLALVSAWGGQRLSAELVWRGQRAVDLHEVEASFGADLLRQFVPVALSGTLGVQLAELQLRDGRPNACTGRLVWRDGGWQSPRGLLPLGSYVLACEQAPGAPLNAEVLTLSGPVQAAGTVELAGDAYAIDIQVSDPGGLDPQLEQALSLLAQPGAGGFQIRLEGRL